jgi:RNA polymerase-binding transcription factor DksA
MADFADIGREATEQEKKFAVNYFQKIQIEKEEKIKRLRVEKNLPEGFCIYCGKEIEDGRRILNLPDCLECHRKFLKK